MNRLVQLTFWAALLFAFVMALLPKPPQLPGDPGDKVQHIAAFAVLTVLAATAYPAVSAKRVALGLAGFGALIELCQSIPSLHRDASFLDWIADVGAVLVVLALMHAFRRLRPR